MNKLKSIFPYLLLLGITLLTIVYGQSLSGQYAFLRRWSWENLAWIALGLPFLWMQPKLGLPHWLGHNAPRRKAWMMPMVVGIGFGLLDVLVIRGLLHPEPYDQLPPFLQPFPYALLLYPSGALDVEIFYRLIPISILAWIFSRWRANGPSLQAPVTGYHLLPMQWIVIVLTSLREPLEQMPAGPAWFVVYSLASGLAMNAFQGLSFLRFGFLSALLVRLGHYLVWHILQGIWVQYVEQAAV